MATEQEVLKLVDIINPKNNQQFINFTNDPRDTIIVPPKGRMLKSLTTDQIKMLAASNLQYQIK